MTIDGEDSAKARALSTLASRPSIVLSAKTLQEFDSSRMDSKTALPITGMATLSSNEPLAPAQLTVESLPTTRAQTINTASGITGFTFPGIIDEPGCKSGILISASPVFGPEPIQRRSLLIFVKLTAMVFICPLTSTSESLAPCASK